MLKTNHRPTDLIVAAARGMVAAVVTMFVFALIHGELTWPGTGLAYNARHAAWVTFRQDVVLVLSVGALLGIAFRKFPSNAASLRVLRWILPGCFSVIVVVAIYLGSRLVRGTPFVLNTLRPSLQAGATEQEVRSTLGEPAAIELQENFVFMGHQFSDCLDRKPAKAFLYASEHSGSYRIVYFDASGRLVCDYEGFRTVH